MNKIYLIMRGTWYANQTGGLTFTRIKKTWFVTVERSNNNLPFWKYFRAILFGKVSRYFGRIVDDFYNSLNVLSGNDKNIRWKKSGDKYYPVDIFYGVELPELAVKELPKNAKVIA